jgi:hypothetical protein
VTYLDSDGKRVLRLLSEARNREIQTVLEDADGGNGDRPTRSRRFTYDLANGELPSHAVVRTVAAITNESPLDLKPSPTQSTPIA